MTEEKLVTYETPDEVKSVIDFVLSFPDDFRVDGEYSRREKVWIRIQDLLLTEYEKGPLSRQKYLKISGGLNAAKEWLSDHDALTSLYNRRGFKEFLRREIDETETANGRLTVFVFDVDDLKEINDSLGHDAGDRTLMTVADLTKKFMPKGSLAARIGGDEFALIIPRTSLVESKKVALEIIEGIRQSDPIDGRKISISVGGGEWKAGDDKDKFLKKIDEKALYLAKESGKAVFPGEESGSVLGMIE